MSQFLACSLSTGVYIPQQCHSSYIYVTFLLLSDLFFGQMMHVHELILRSSNPPFVFLFHVVSFTPHSPTLIEASVPPLSYASSVMFPCDLF